jgi:hypothetical protein
MIVGSHVMVFSRNPDIDRDFLRDVLKLTHVDAGGGWLIFGLPPSEVALHPTEGAEKHELFLICKNVEQFIREMTSRELACTPVREERWGLITELTLPGGGKLGVYEPRHARPKTKAVRSTRRTLAKKPSAKIRKRPKVSSRGKRTRR